MNEKIALLIKNGRIHKKISQETLADYLSVSVSTVSKWENGIRTPDLITFFKICKYLEIDMSEFFVKKQQKSFKSKINTKNIIIFTFVLVLLLFGILSWTRLKKDNCAMYEIISMDDKYHVVGNLFMSPEYEILDIHQVDIMDFELSNTNAYFIDYSIYVNDELITRMYNVRTHQIGEKDPIDDLYDLVNREVKFYSKEFTDYDEFITGVPKRNFYILIHALLEEKEILEIKIPLKIEKIYSD